MFVFWVRRAPKLPVLTQPVPALISCWDWLILCLPYVGIKEGFTSTCTLCHTWIIISKPANKGILCEHSCQPRKGNYHQRRWRIQTNLVYFTDLMDPNTVPGLVPGFVATAYWPTPSLLTWTKRAQIHTHAGQYMPATVNKSLIFSSPFLNIFYVFFFLSTLLCFSLCINFPTSDHSFACSIQLICLDLWHVFSLLCSSPLFLLLYLPINQQECHPP